VLPKFFRICEADALYNIGRFCKLVTKITQDTLQRCSRGKHCFVLIRKH
jgi:hypothetical protein